MTEISLHILDIAHNSIAANATLVEISVEENVKNDTLTFIITDNGKGMDKEMLSSVTDPFTTGRTTRKVGLGIPLVKQACEMTGGYLELSSEIGVGTKLKAVLGYSHIDRQPLGDMSQTMHQLITSFEEIDFLYTHKINENEFMVDTREIKKILGGVSLKENEISLWLLEYLKDGESQLS